MFLKKIKYFKEFIKVCDYEGLWGLDVSLQGTMVKE